MTHPFILTPSAARDIEEILDYVIDQSGSNRAHHVQNHLFEGLAKIADEPGIGHCRTDLADESLRVWRVFAYLIVYRPDTSPVQIIRVLHGARDLPGTLEG